MRRLQLLRHSLFVCCLLGVAGKSGAQDIIYSNNIASPQLYVSGNQLAYPVLHLNSSDKLELHFDDLDADVKNYYYTFQLCNADWTPAIVSQFDFINGFSQIQVSDYQFSSVALTHYTHYQAVIPDRNCIPIHSGNYLLKVFLYGDTSKMAFSRRFLVLDQKLGINAQVLQPLDNNLLRTHQRLQFELNTAAVNPANPLEQIKVVVLQNYRWDNASTNARPTIYINNKLQYNSEDAFLFPGGSEWRWADLQSFRFQSDRIQRVNNTKNATEIFLKPDADRSQGIYIRYQDYNGGYFIQTTESINTLLQTDYATVHFYFVPPANSPFPDKDVYLFGSLTGWATDDSSRMHFNKDRGAYETSLFLKMGYYSYGYTTIARDDPSRKFSMDFTEGNHMETENNYTILVYYRALGGRADELVGMSTISSITGRPGF
ncbi:MAG: DUF5103 domain-containing protein [Puia sp.]|nr:DUF5103 domain-containing protein [Puia sp.]